GRRTPGDFGGAAVAGRIGGGAAHALALALKHCGAGNGRSMHGFSGGVVDRSTSTRGYGRGSRDRGGGPMPLAAALAVADRRNRGIVWRRSGSLPVDRTATKCKRPSSSRHRSRHRWHGRSSVACREGSRARTRAAHGRNRFGTPRHSNNGRYSTAV